MKNHLSNPYLNKTETVQSVYDSCLRAGMSKIPSYGKIIREMDRRISCGVIVPRVWGRKGKPYEISKKDVYDLAKSFC